MRKVILGISSCIVMFGFTATAGATAFPKPNNPNLVAYYTDGDHGIPGDYTRHTGKDAVKANGNSGNFQQWFYGTSEDLSEGVHGHHTVWKVEKSNGCPNQWLEMVTPNPAWGDYLKPGVNYCVKTNDYK